MLAKVVLSGLNLRQEVMCTPFVTVDFFLVIGFFSWFNSDFITITLQLPVEGGHEGGRVVVRHRSDDYLFDSAESSSSHFYLTASYSDCALEFEEVTLGWRLAVVFGLTPEFPVVAPPELPDSLIHRSVTRILGTWAQLPPSPLKYLAIPFRHRYDPDVYRVNPRQNDKSRARSCRRFYSNLVSVLRKRI